MQICVYIFHFGRVARCNQFSHVRFLICFYHETIDLYMVHNNNKENVALNLKKNNETC